MFAHPIKRNRKATAIKNQRAGRTLPRTRSHKKPACSVRSLFVSGNSFAKATPMGVGDIGNLESLGLWSGSGHGHGLPDCERSRSQEVIARSQ
jgi:hypothetical protein